MAKKKSTTNRTIRRRTKHKKGTANLAAPQPAPFFDQGGQLIAVAQRKRGAAVQATEGVTNPISPMPNAGFPSPLPIPTLQAVTRLGPGGTPMAVVGMTPIDLTPPPAALNLTSTPPEVRVQPSPPQAGSVLAGEGDLNANADLLRGPQTVHAELLKRLAAIEAIIPQLPGLGHNNPPEPIASLPPITLANIEQIKVDIRFVGGLPPGPDEVPTRVGQIYGRLKKFGEEIRNWIAIAGSIAGVAMAIWKQFGDELTSASDLISEWIKLLMHLT